MRVRPDLPTSWISGGRFSRGTRYDKHSRIDIANVVAAQLRAVGIHCTVETPAQVDWDGQMAYLSGV